MSSRHLTRSSLVPNSAGLRFHWLPCCTFHSPFLALYMPLIETFIPLIQVWNPDTDDSYRIQNMNHSLY